MYINKGVYKMPFVDYGFKSKIFHGVELQYAAIEDFKEDEIIYLGEDVDTCGDVYDIIMDKTGKYYYTVL